MIEDDSFRYRLQLGRNLEFLRNIKEQQQISLVPPPPGLRKYMNDLEEENQRLEALIASEETKNAATTQAFLIQALRNCIRDHIEADRSRDKAQAIDAIVEDIRRFMIEPRGIVPNETTIAAMKEAQDGDLQSFNSVQEVMAHLDSDDAEDSVSIALNRDNLCDLLICIEEATEYYVDILGDGRAEGLRALRDRLSIWVEYLDGDISTLEEAQERMLKNAK